MTTSKQLRLLPERRNERTAAFYVDIGRFTPSADTASTGYALVSPDSVLVYVPRAEGFDVDLRAMHGDFQAEWFDIQRLIVTPAAPVRAGTTLTEGSP